MSHVILRLITRFAPIVTLPVAVVIGFIGYNIESNVSSRYTPSKEISIIEEREKRLLHQDELEEQTVAILEKNHPSKLKKH